MLPAYEPGDTLVGWRWFRPRPGQVVVAGLHGLPVIKRIKRIDGEQVWLVGDNPADSIDSRSLGPVSRRDVFALIILKLP